MKTYRVIGVMSGTSLDGIDIALCDFFQKEGKWNYSLVDAKTFTYDEKILLKLKKAISFSGLELMLLHNELGDLIGNKINEFLQTIHLDKTQIHFVSSHGHTIFHQPQNKLTTQIGNGANISAITKLPVVCDFRTVDVALSGNGAPLVPIGDKLLFSNFDACINLGGIANISFEKNNQSIAFDICPVNIVLNHYANTLGFKYDSNGNLAQRGKLNIELLNKLNNLDYYMLKHPKSLGIEWINKHIFPLIDSYNISIEDKLNIFCEHIAIQINKVTINSIKKILITGGGTYNSYLISSIKNHLKSEIIIPDNKTIEFKEALIFAFLGVLRVEKETNCISSVTGSIHDNIGGCIYQTTL